MQAENAGLFIWESLTPQKDVKSTPNGSMPQFDFILELFMLLGFMNVSSLKEWRMFQLPV